MNGAWTNGSNMETLKASAVNQHLGLTLK